MSLHASVLCISPKAESSHSRNHVDFLCNAYKYLMDYYRAGDKVYIFGFSRGAYTARALAGMIQKVGLLPPGNHNQIKLCVFPALATSNDHAYRRKLV